MKRFIKFSLVCAMLIGSNAFAAGDAALGKAKSAACVACHGADGNSANAMWPKLAGQHESYLIEQMHEFKKGDKGGRNEPTMLGMTAGLSDADIANLAAYFASQKTSPGKAQASLVDLGEKIYRGGNSATGVTACISCHGPKGLGNEAAKFPRLSGQHATYTATQLQHFAEGKRHAPGNTIMNDIAAKMTQEEIQAVSSYIEGLH